MVLWLLALLSTAFSQIAPYCSSGPYSYYDTNLYGVSLQGDVTKINDPSSSCPGVIGVRDLTALNADLTVGATYTLNYVINSCGTAYPVRSAAWIDWNADFAFQASEQLFPSSVSFGNQAWNFTVPATAESGLTRLRVQVQEYGVDPLNPCEQFNYGATTDFGVTIKSGVVRYCESGPTTETDMNLGPVQLTGFTSSINDNSDCPATIGPKDLTHLMADFNPGSSYTLNYQVTDCDPTTPPWPTLSGGWIDYNQNGFFEPWEQIGVSQQTGLADISMTFTVPFSTSTQEVIPGNTFLRVQVQETNAEELEPCAHFAWGGTKDFTIRIWESKNYCISGPTSKAATALGDITLMGQTTNINDPATCADAQTGPVDHTLMVADLNVAQPYTITYNVLGCSAQFQTYSAVWADYNHNEMFETWEQITPRSGAFGTVTAGFKIPPSAPNQVVVGGPTRLRVQVQQTSENKALDPCAQFTSGGTRDYTLNIRGSFAME